MRTVFVLSVLLLGATDSFGQADLALARPVPGAPAVRLAQTPPATRGGMVIRVTDPQGLLLEGIRVSVIGASDRSADTSPTGQVNFPGLQAGTYRLRFSGDAVITFEREITLRARQVANVDVTLNPAPPKVLPPPPAPPPPPTPPVAGPAGKPQVLSIVDLVERELIRDEPRRETLLSCSGNTRTTMLQLSQDQPQRLYDTADVGYYVIAGEGVVRIGGQETSLAPSTYVSVPRGETHALTRRGRRPLILLAVVSGAPCEESR